MASAVELITADHRTVEQLYQRYQEANGQSQSQQAIIQRSLSRVNHPRPAGGRALLSRVERKLGKEGVSLVQEARKEHSDMKRAIGQLQTRQFTGPECAQVFATIMSGVQYYVKEEESEMLPRAQQQLGAESERLGAQMQERKQALQADK